MTRAVPCRTAKFAIVRMSASDPLRTLAGPDSIRDMRSYTDQPGTGDGYGGLLFRALVGFVLVGSGFWIGYDGQPKAAMIIAVLATLGIVAVTAVRAWILHASRN